ncbi:MAG: D-alanine--D-alanine ligase [Candidatus Bipolaricaulota bacterium]
MDPRDVKIAVLCGGDSAEREISRRSGSGILRALRRREWRAELVEIQDYNGLPQRLRSYGAVFNTLHGAAGEDGTVQLLLELMGVPYVGSDPAASARAMDKAETHQRLYGTGLATADWKIIPADTSLRGTVPNSVGYLGFPLVVKPRREGSSVGLHLVEDAESISSAVQEVAARYGDVLVERYIPGRELTVAVLDENHGPHPLPVVELIPRGHMFDFSAKYTPGHCRFVCPADLSRSEEQAVHKAALDAHRALGCRDFSRADIRLHPDGTAYVLELNTLPGMTEMSTFPRAAAAAGIPYDELLERLLLRAISRLPNPSALG